MLAARSGLTSALNCSELWHYHGLIIIFWEGISWREVRVRHLGLGGQYEQYGPRGQLGGPQRPRSTGERSGQRRQGWLFRGLLFTSCAFDFLSAGRNVARRAYAGYGRPRKRGSQCQ